MSIRKKENNSILPQEPYDEPKVCQISPKDILSFAWQITNGMSYLSDIKVFQFS